MKPALRTLLSMLFLVIASARGAEVSRPGIIFILSDDHARHTISAGGSKVNETPGRV